MRKGWLIWFLVFVSSAIAFGQSVTDIEIVYLKNGSVIKGIVLQKDTLGTVDIYNSEGTTLSYPYSEVDKIVPYREPRKPIKYVPPVIYKERKGLYVLGKGGILPNGLYSFYGSLGYRIHSQVHVGVGMGFDSYVDIQYGILPNFSSNIKHVRDGFLPIYFDSRFFLSRESTSMFIFMNVGYAWQVTGGQIYTRDSNESKKFQTIDGGLFAVTGFGLKFKLSSKVSGFVDLGIRIQNYTQRTFTLQQVAGRPYKWEDISKTALTPCWTLGVIF